MFFAGLMKGLICPVFWWRKLRISWGWFFINSIVLPKDQILYSCVALKWGVAIRIILKVGLDVLMKEGFLPHPALMTTKIWLWLRIRLRTSSVFQKIRYRFYHRTVVGVWQLYCELYGDFFLKKAYEIQMFTSPKTNMSHENQWLVQRYFLLNRGHVSFQGCKPKQPRIKRTWNSWWPHIWGEGQLEARHRWIHGWDLIHSGCSPFQVPTMRRFSFGQKTPSGGGFGKGNGTPYFQGNP